jgi:hypothetical protein
MISRQYSIVSAVRFVIPLWCLIIYQKVLQKFMILSYEGLAPEDHRAALLPLLNRWLLEDPELKALSRLAQGLNPEEILKRSIKPLLGLYRECGADITLNEP